MKHAQAQAVSTLTDEQHGSSILRIRNLKAFLPRKKLSGNSRTETCAPLEFNCCLEETGQEKAPCSERCLA